MSITVKLLTLIQSVGLTSPGLGGVVLYLGGRASLPRGSWHLSSPTRDGTPVSCLGRQILNHGTTQKGHMLPQLYFNTHVGVMSIWFYSLCRFMSPQPQLQLHKVLHIVHSQLHLSAHLPWPQSPKTTNCPSFPKLCHFTSDTKGIIQNEIFGIAFLHIA